MASKKVSIIIGDGRCGKSSLVRALTGVYRSASVRIGTKNGEENWTRVMPQSAQEAELSPEELLKKLDEDWGSTHALVVLRLYPYNGHPSAQEYIKSLTVKHELDNVLFMGKEAQVDIFKIENIKPNVLISTYSRSTNANANFVREKWGWL